ncbi:MAG: cell envelope integrity protein TolA [Sphingomonadaceae bacterium]
MKPVTAGGPYKVPRQHDGMRSMLMALAMHLGLLMFLWVGIRWQNNDPVAVEAEVWDMTVQTAAPPAPPAPPAPEEEEQPEPEVQAPPPPAPAPVEAPPKPAEPDIALERLKAKKKAELEKQEQQKQAKLKQEAEEKLAKLEEKKLADKKAKAEKEKQEKQEKQDKLDKEKEKKLAAEKLAKSKQEKAAEKAREKARAAEMLRITGAVGAGTSGTAARATGPRSDGSYEAAVKAKIKGNLVYATNDDSLTATFRILQAPTGDVMNVRKIKGSGSAAYDNAIENAINKSSPLPKKKDGTVEREFDAVFTMKDLH